MARIKNLLPAFIITLLVLGIIFSCSGPQIREEQTLGVYHRVKKGETAYSIARVYNIKLQDLADINNIEDPSLIKEGAVLFIPGAKYVIEDVMTYVKEIDTKPRGEINSVQKPEEQPSEAEKQKVQQSEPKTVEIYAEDEKREAANAQKMFIWPVQGTVKTRFGREPNNTYHNWIKIVAPAGTPVKAAAAGTVIFSSQIKDYGQTVIIRHEQNFTTVYTHLNKRYVKADQSVKQAETIALVGEKDESGIAYINFEIRVKGKASNPLSFLP